MKIQKVFIVGDTHGRWDLLNSFLNKLKNDSDLLELSKEHEVEVVILQVGDFGWFPHLQSDEDQYGIYNHVPHFVDEHIKIYWCPGNHENWFDIEDKEKNHSNQPFEFNKDQMPYIFYCPFGSMLTLHDNRTVMFCGGADSIDKYIRTEGIDWWRNEVITYSDMLKLPLESTDVDIIISHTCPTYFNIIDDVKIHNQIYKDSSRDYLDQVFDMFKPSLYFFGHFHRFKENKYKDCKWTALDMINGDHKWNTEL